MPFNSKQFKKELTDCIKTLQLPKKYNPQIQQILDSLEQEKVSERNKKEIVQEVFLALFTIPELENKLNIQKIAQLVRKYDLMKLFPPVPHLKY